MFVLISRNMEPPVIENSKEAFPGFKSPATICVSGVSGSGKTTLVYKILKQKDTLFEEPIHKILYCYSIKQPIFNEILREISNVEFYEGMPDEDKIVLFGDLENHNLIILDDMMESIVKSVDAQNLATKYSHHRNISTLYISQNLFLQGKCSKSISINTHYFIIMCNPRDIKQISTLAAQTGLGMILIESYRDCVLNKKYGYQLISLHPRDLALNTDSPRIRSKIHTNIFQGEMLISYL